ncbi:nitroreductase family protein [Parendozoicomonas haliclonae]|uniref:Putative NAD(P)H nitroreductase n=1 Tax=Parendozoicomonas haliclonae TaxID=1960125 RepID=A0A1X7AMD1_9GAMM|nr:nitroreductase [Parendozoicomonas haliclonae]SMA49354.1 putative NAD(P)H nitroreductase YdjA [Parendozoicomonas haliclonae]
MDALDVLTQRISRPVLTEPAPSSEQIELMIRAACRAPDHAGLRPYRFIRIEGERRKALGELLCAAGLELDPQLSEVAQEKLRNAPLRAPMLLLPVLTSVSHPKVPEVEQVLTVGAAVSNILNTAFALGVGAMWRSGLPSFQRSLARGLGLAEHEQLLGFLYLGTPAGRAKPVSEVNLETVLSDW